MAEFTESTVVQPGDVLVLCVAPSITRQAVDEMTNYIVRRRPELADRVLIVAGTGLAAVRQQAGVYDEVRAERGRQVVKWGEQNHPDADPVILARLHAGGPYGTPGEVAGRLATEHGIPTAGRARRACQVAAERGETNWTAIAVEELAEALEATTKGDATLRAELVQLAAVAVAWIEAIDRRQGGRDGN